MNSAPFNSIDQELQFYKKLLDSVPAIINVNQIDDLSDPSKSTIAWGNTKLYEFTGYSKEELKKLGFEFFVKTMHPDDLELVGSSVLKLIEGKNSVHGGMMRIKSKDGDYKWFIGTMTVMETKNDKPWRFVICIHSLEEMQDTQNQIVQLIRENLQLKSQLIINSLSQREKEIIKHIANGHTDKVIADILCISPATVKTHRHNIIQKLNLKNKASIVQVASETGLI